MGVFGLNFVKLFLGGGRKPVFFNTESTRNYQIDLYCLLMFYKLFAEGHTIAVPRSFFVVVKLVVLFFHRIFLPNQ